MIVVYSYSMGLYHPSRDELELPAVLHALSDPHRLHIVKELDAEHPHPQRCGTFALAITKSTLTHHFRVLREAGVIEQRMDGTAKLNRLRREDLDARFPGLLDAVLESAPKAEPARVSA
jgi:DNA-binding transcriptional ArsR family regulator